MRWLLVLLPLWGAAQPELDGLYMDAKLGVGESWWASGDTLHGRGLEIKGDDTVSFERLRIFQNDSSWTYRVSLPAESGVRVVDFTGDKRPSGQWVFVNPENDYPAKLTYHISNAGLIIILQGSESEEPSPSLRLDMKKVAARDESSTR